MKKTILIFTLIAGLFINKICGQSVDNKTNKIVPTSIGFVIYSNDIETIWNALRLANYSKNQGDTVSFFLLGKGVELENLVKTDKNIKEQSDTFLKSGGTIFGCGTCLNSRNNDEPKVCKFSSLKDLYELIRKNNKVLTF